MGLGLGGFLAVLAAVLGSMASAQDRAGDFDHYVLALSWNASWCEAEGDADGRAQCDIGRGHVFTVHGLWPQHRDGWPEFCRSDARDPSRRETAAMADLMGSGGLAWYQWRKHGRCSGLHGAAYLDLTRAAAARVRVPPGFARIEEPVSLDPDIVEEAFLAANEALRPDGVIVTCREGRLHEVRICFDKGLQPQRCHGQQGRACARDRVRVPPVR